MVPIQDDEEHDACCAEILCTIPSTKTWGQAACQLLASLCKSGFAEDEGSSAAQEAICEGAPLATILP
eukprot:8082696-Karenia_brevis.AAC.1